MASNQSVFRVIEDSLPEALFQVRRRFALDYETVYIDHVEADASPTGREQWIVTAHKPLGNDAA